MVHSFNQSCIALLIYCLLNVSCLAQSVILTQSHPRDFSKLTPPSVEFEVGPVIPGLSEGAVPQGLAYLTKSNCMLISHDHKKSPSCVSVINNKSGMLLGSVLLKDQQGEMHFGHVGGLAVADESLFVASDGYLYQYELESFLADTFSKSVMASASRRCETKADYCTANANILFVGEFAYGFQYQTNSKHHLKDRKGVRKYAWVCGYDLADPLGPPKCVISVRQRVQGMFFYQGKVLLSLSYGRKNRSTIVVYRDPLKEPPHRQVQISNGSTVPLWFLDGENYLGEIDFPPMAEGIAMVNDRLAVLSESGATKYQSGGRGPLDVVLMLRLDEYKH